MGTQKFSRTYRRIKRKTPGGRILIAYERPKKRTATCSGCGISMKGIIHAKNAAASKRNPSRPYAGVFCTKCMRSTIKNLMVR